MSDRFYFDGDNMRIGDDELDDDGEIWLLLAPSDDHVSELKPVGGFVDTDDGRIGSIQSDCTNQDLIVRKYQ